MYHSHSGPRLILVRLQFNGGILFLGIALGPMLGSFIIKASGNTLMPFYVALAMHVAYSFVTWAVLPESLSIERQRDARARHRANVAARKEASKAALGAARRNGSVAVWMHQATGVLLSPLMALRPLLLLLPRKRSVDEPELDRPAIELLSAPRAGWDFALAKIALAWACYMLGKRSPSCS